MVKLCLLSKSGEKLAESTTDPIRLAVDEVWSGVANYNQSVLLASESQTAAAALHVSLIDEDTAEFAEDDDDEEFVEKPLRLVRTHGLSGHARDPRTLERNSQPPACCAERS